MGFAETMRVLSNINCAASSLNTYTQMSLRGVNPMFASYELSNNLANGVVRNEIAYDMQKHGSFYGNNVNLYAGYGNPVSNAIGTMGIMAGCSPWMMFNCPSYMFSPMPMPMGYGGFGMMSCNMGFYV